MKSIQSILFAFVVSFSSAQVPQSFKYQAVVRGNNGSVLVNQLVSFQLSILKDNPNGNVVYSERQNLSTNSYGIVNINVGTGTIISGDFTTIAWGNFSHFIKVEFDAAGGNNFQFMGTSQILSVPYALYAESAGSANNDNDTDPTNELQAVSISNDTLYLSNGGQVYLGEYLDNSDEQTLTLSGGNTLSISGGNSIVLSQGLADADADPSNELQTLTINNDVISISDGNSITLPPDLPDGDSNPTNEIQSLSINNDVISISGANSITLPAIPPDGDSDDTNELQTLSYSNNILSISGGNSLSIATSRTLTLPHGTDNIIPVIDSVNQSISYTVPSGKTLYVTYIENSNALIINGNYYSLNEYYLNGSYPFFPTGTTFNTSATLNNTFTGFLVDNISDITPLLLLLSTTQTYSVPNGKILVLLVTDNLKAYLKVNGIRVFPDNSTPVTSNIVTMPSGSIISTTQGIEQGFIGYLK